jgi:hypothetical protein
LAHFFKVSSVSSFPPPACTESAEEPISVGLPQFVGWPVAGEE